MRILEASTVGLDPRKINKCSGQLRIKVSRSYPERMVQMTILVSITVNGYMFRKEPDAGKLYVWFLRRTRPVKGTSTQSVSGKHEVSNA